MTTVAMVLATLIASGAHVATKYVSPKLTVRATRRLFRCRGEKPKFDPYVFEAVVHVGRPNFEERRFIADCNKAKYSFPIKAIQVKHIPVPKPAPKKAAKKRRR